MEVFQWKYSFFFNIFFSDHTNYSSKQWRRNIQGVCVGGGGGSASFQNTKKSTLRDIFFHKLSGVYEPKEPHCWAVHWFEIRRLAVNKFLMIWKITVHVIIHNKGSYTVMFYTQWYWEITALGGLHNDNCFSQCIQRFALNHRNLLTMLVQTFLWTLFFFLRFILLLIMWGRRWDICIWVQVPIEARRFLIS